MCRYCVENGLPDKCRAPADPVRAGNAPRRSARKQSAPSPVPSADYFDSSLETLPALPLFGSPSIPHALLVSWRNEVCLSGSELAFARLEEAAAIAARDRAEAAVAVAVSRLRFANARFRDHVARYSDLVGQVYMETSKGKGKGRGVDIIKVESDDESAGPSHMDLS